MQISRKLPLSTLDTFMFNDARSGLIETRCYDVLENLKDCCTIAFKYSSEIIQFKTPNGVIVFWTPGLPEGVLSNRPCPSVGPLVRGPWSVRL